MAQYRNPDESVLTPQPTPPSTFNIGNKPPLVNWTCVVGDSAAFRIYVQDDQGDPIVPSDWEIKADFRRYTLPNEADLLFSITPSKTEFDGPGEFTVFVEPSLTKQLRTKDVFDVQLTDALRVWTVCQGEMIMIGEVTDQDV